MRGGAVVAAAVGLVLTACSGPDPALVSELEATGLVLRAPELRGSEPVDVAVGDGRVRVDHDRDGHGLYTLEIGPAPDGDLCSGVTYESGSACEGDDETMVASFEEMTVVAVRRGDEVLVARNLVTEADQELTDDALTALRGAAAVSAEELAGFVA